MVSPHQCKEHYIFAIMTKQDRNIPYTLHNNNNNICISRPVQLQKYKIHFSGRIQLYQSLQHLAKILVESYLCQNALAKLHGHTFQVGQLNVK